MTTAVSDLLSRGVDAAALPVSVDRRVRLASWLALVPSGVLLALLLRGGAALPSGLPGLLVLRLSALTVLGGLSLAVWTRGFRRAGRLLHALLVALVLSGAVALLVIPVVVIAQVLS